MTAHQGQHLTADEVYLFAKEKMPNIGIATVYRTLERLATIGVLYKSVFEPGRYRYELYDDTSHYHHHVICLGCGMIFEVEEDLLFNLEQSLQNKGFKIVDHDLKFFGYCPACKENWQETSNQLEAGDKK